MQYLCRLKLFHERTVCWSLLKAAVLCVSQQFCFHLLGFLCGGTWGFLNEWNNCQVWVKLSISVVTPTTFREVCACQLVYVSSSRHLQELAWVVGSGYNQSCFWSWWMNPGSGGWRWQSQPSLWMQGESMHSPCLEIWTEKLVGKCSSLLPLVNLCLPLGKTAWISRIGKNDPKHVMMAWFFFSCSEIRVALGCSRCYDLQKMIWCFQGTRSVRLFINLAYKWGSRNGSDSGLYCCLKSPIQRAKQTQVISLTHRN